MRQSVIFVLSFLAGPAMAHELDATSPGDTGFFDPGDAPIPADTGDDGDPIINGTPATIDDYPMAGAYMFGATFQAAGNREIRMVLCSSTLIAPDTVMLAAHCVDPEVLRASLGSYRDLQLYWSRQADLSNFSGMGAPDWPDDAVSVLDTAKNPDFEYRTMRMGLAENNDIGLAFLSQALTTPNGYLPTVDEAAQIVVNNPVAIVGWGQQTDDTTPPRGTYGEKMMGNSFIAELGDAEMQIGATVTDVRKCHGDSGGPTFMNVTTDSPEIMRVIGVTSHSYDTSDCKRKGGVDTRVDAHLDWINSEMTARCENGSRVWCDVPGIIPPPAPIPVDTGSDASDDSKDDTAGTCGCSSKTPAKSAFPLVLALGLIVRRKRR
jgi:hypothetical protein